MLVTVKIEGYLSFDFALVQWYDFWYNAQQHLFKYGCPLLRITNTYNFVPVKSIIELIQVFKHTERPNEYFVNVYMF